MEGEKELTTEAWEASLTVGSRNHHDGDYDDERMVVAPEEILIPIASQTHI